MVWDMVGEIRNRIAVSLKVEGFDIGFEDGSPDDENPAHALVHVVPRTAGVRVKLLEAFAAGIPTVSTYLGAEGLARSDGEFCALADDPAGFAERVLALFGDAERCRAMAARARADVEANWDMAAITRKLAESYRKMVARKRTATSASGSDPS